jgi:hypothetical protein
LASAPLAGTRRDEDVPDLFSAAGIFASQSKIAMNGMYFAVL